MEELHTCLVEASAAVVGTDLDQHNNRTDPSDVVEAADNRLNDAVEAFQAAPFHGECVGASV